jgi:hypothetical protein
LQNNRNAIGKSWLWNNLFPVFAICSGGAEPVQCPGILRVTALHLADKASSSASPEDS